jgi:hypothetical protein
LQPFFSHRGGKTNLKRSTFIVAFAALVVCLVPMSGSAASFVDWTPCPAQNQWLVCPTGYVGQPYSIQLLAHDGCDLYRWEIVNGKLPDGLKMSDDGKVTGTPAEAIELRPWVWVHDRLPSEGGYTWCIGDNHSERQFIFTTKPGLDIDQSGATVPPATVNQAYPAQKFTVSSLTHLNPRQSTPTTASWRLASGSLPSGMNFSSDGVLSGTPTQTGSFQFVILAEQGGISDRETKTLTVRDPVAVNSPFKTTATAPQRLEVDVPYTLTQSATGGSGAFTWTLASGTLPTGVVMNPDGTVTGTPTAPGSYPVSIKVADTEGRSSTLAATFIVADRLAIPVFKLKTAIANRAYRQKIERTGGVAPLEWTLVRGKLPKGVTLAKRLGLLLGKPTKAGKYRLVVEAVDAYKVKASANLTLVVKTK